MASKATQKTSEGRPAKPKHEGNQSARTMPITSQKIANLVHHLALEPSQSISVFPIGGGSVGAEPRAEGGPTAYKSIAKANHRVGPQDADSKFVCSGATEPEGPWVVWGHETPQPRPRGVGRVAWGPGESSSRV